MWKRNKNKEDGVVPLILGRKIESNEETREVPAIMKGPKLEYVKLLDGKEEVKNPKSFLQMIVNGQSVAPFGVRNGNLILVEKTKDPAFPAICVFKRKAGFFNRAHYSVAKVWKRGENVEEVLEDSEFKKMGLDSVLHSFEDKPEDPVIITWLEDEGWCLRYRSFKDIIGVVRYAYDI